LSEARVGKAIAGGARSASDVYAFCGVERNCGRCQETIETMLRLSQPAQTLEAAE
jgi:bacterioferritin-associated ferredoxin